MENRELRGTRLEEGQYGERLTAILELDSAATFVARPAPGAEIAMTNMRCLAPSPDFVGKARCEDAYVLSVSLLEGFQRDCRVDGQLIELPPQPVGYVTVLDRRRTILPRYRSAVHNLSFDFSIGGLREIAKESHLARFGDLKIEKCKPVLDEVTHHLSTSVLPAFERPGQANRLFIDHIGAALAIRLLQSYGGLEARSARGGLAPWQQKRAEEMLVANLAGDVSLATIAAECRLSASHFVRAFRLATGLPPHRWLLKHRVEKAKTMLRESPLPLSDVAECCGFADQSHFTRVFTRWAGQAPGAWRRRVQ